MLFVYKIFKIAANIKSKQIVKNSKMKRFQWIWIFTGSKTCCTICRPFWFAILAILNQKWPPKYKDPPIWAKFGFQVDYDVTNWYSSLVVKLSIVSDFNENWYLGVFWSDELVGALNSKIKEWATWTAEKKRKVSSSCSTCGTHHDTQVLWYGWYTRARL